jgi:hypothetical protein
MKSRLRKLGAVAQLGERVLCKHDVAGSIPVSSKLEQSGKIKFEILIFL